MNRFKTRFSGFRKAECFRPEIYQSGQAEGSPQIRSSVRALAAIRRFVFFGFIAGIISVLTSIPAAAQQNQPRTGRGSVFEPGYSIGSKWERNPSGDRYGQFSGGQGNSGFNQANAGYGPHHGGGHHGGGHHHGGGYYGNPGPGFAPGWGYGGGFGGYPNWDPGYQYPAGFIYGGYPIVPPPAYIRNSDGALFISPGFLPPFGYGYPYGYGYGFDGGFRYGTGGGFYNQGYAQGYDASWGSLAVPLPGMIPSFMTFNFGSQNLGGRGSRSSAGYSVIPKIQPLPPGERVTNDGLPPRMKVTPGVEDLQLSPVPDETLPPVDENRANGDDSEDNNNLPVPVPGDASRAPVIDEFPPIPVTQKKTSLQDRLHSIRQQAGGDEAFRNRDLKSAIDSYQSSIDSAPERRAPYLRMVFALLQQSKFPEAVSYLKTGLNLENDSTRAWITAKELHGGTATESIQSSSRRLWAWVTEKPLSTDRLLLMGAFQKWRGMNRTGDDVITAIEQTQASNAYAMALRSLTDEQSPAVVRVPPRGRSSNFSTDAGRAVAAPPRSLGVPSSRETDSTDLTIPETREESDGVTPAGASTVAEEDSAPGDELIIPPANDSK